MNYFDSFLTIGSIAAAVCVATGVADYAVTRRQRQAVKNTDRSKKQRAATQRHEGETTRKRVGPREAAPHDIETTTDSGLFWKAALLSGLVTVALGVAIVSWPGISTLVASVFFGVYLLASGLAQVAFAFSLRRPAGGRVILFISGAASLILALLTFRHFDNAVLLLAIWVGIGLVFRGVAITVSTFSEPGLPGRGWHLFYGIVTLLAGVTVIASPIESIVTLAWVVGVWFIATGDMEIVAAFGMRAAATKSSADATAQITAF